MTKFSSTTYYYLPSTNFSFSGVVLETYGNGNIPIKRKEIYKEIEAAVKNKVLVVNVTQCINGTVIAKPLYETGLVSRYYFLMGNRFFLAATVSHLIGTVYFLG